MKVAISTQGNDLDALVDPRFGRARWFIIADSETAEWVAVDNAANVGASGGAGVQAASTVAEQGVKAVITGNVGPNAQKALAAGSIAIHQAANGVTAKAALEAFGRGELPTLEAPSVSGHWS